MSTPVVELHHVRAGFPGQVILKDLTLTVGKGELMVIAGPTGAGKTTLVRLLIGAGPMLAGYGRAAGIELHGITRTAATTLRQRIGIIFQSPRFLDRVSVLSNVSLPLAVAGVSNRECRAVATRALLDAGLSIHRGKKPSELSGGEQSRLQIARALIHRPYLILADEPFAHLDPDAAAAAEDMLAAAHARGATILITTHHRTRLMDRARCLNLREGMLFGDAESGS